MRRLLIVDDAPLFRAGSGSALSAAEFEVVGEATTALDAVQRAKVLQPASCCSTSSCPECRVWR